MTVAIEKLCSDCLRRGRHMPWCSNAPKAAPVPPTAPEPPRLRIVKPPPVPKPKARGFDLDELAGSVTARDYVWACEHAGSDPKAAKLKRAIERGQRARLVYLAAGLPYRSVTPGAPPATEAWFRRNTIWGQRQDGRRWKPTHIDELIAERAEVADADA